MVDFQFWKNVFVSHDHNAPEEIWAKWGLTLPDIYESIPDHQTGMVQKIGRFLRCFPSNSEPQI
jgi:hypothetical protein